MVSIDQLISTTPSLISQSTGKLMFCQHHVGTIFVDRTLGFEFVHLQEISLAKDILEANQAFELFAKECGVINSH